MENLTLLAASYQNVYGNLYTMPSDIFAAPYASDIATLLPSTTALGTLESNGARDTGAAVLLERGKILLGLALVHI